MSWKGRGPAAALFLGAAALFFSIWSRTNKDGERGKATQLQLVTLIRF